jgi:LysM repeat protein
VFKEKGNPVRPVRFCLAALLMMLLSAAAFAQDSTQVTYTVQRGDTLFRIALRYGVDMNVLAQTNNIADMTRIRAGQVLVIPGLAQPTTGDVVQNPLVATAPIVHTVQRGESLTIIAGQYGVAVADILSANNIANPNRIFAGQELQIWSAQLSAPAEAPAPEPAVVTPPEPVVSAPTPVPVMATHVVREGEHLSGIARGYGLSWTVLAEANGITDPNRIYAGMTLNIPDAATLAASPIGNLAASVAAVPPARVGAGREIVVDLSSQMTYAFEDGVLMKSSLSSTGLPATPTVQGSYKIYLKYDSQTMSGPGYRLPGVQWVMYFYQGYALHGTYWHSNFGQPMSHGCVNLTNEDAKWFYDFASLGTPVYVQW